MAIRDDILRMTARTPEEWIIKVNNRPYNPAGRECFGSEAEARSSFLSDSTSWAHTLVLEDGVQEHTAEYWTARQAKLNEINTELQAMIADGTVTFTLKQGGP